MATPQCFRCGESDGLSAHRFILTCSSCRKSWHHRCHVPPVSDNELIARIKATDPADGLSAWRCKRCTPAESIEILDLDSPPFESVPIASNHPVIDLTTLCDNADKETAMVDLTTLSDSSSDEQPQLLGLSIDDNSMTEPAKEADQIRHAENNAPLIEWNTCRVHQSIPEIAPLGWMRRALRSRQQRGPRPHQSRVTSSEKFYFNVSDLVVLIQNTSL